MSNSTWMTTSPYRFSGDRPLTLQRRAHDDLHEAALKFEAWMFLEACRFWPSRLLEPERNEWIGMNLLYRDGELTDHTFRSLYYAHPQ